MAAIVVQWVVFASARSFRGNTRARDAAMERVRAAEQLFLSQRRQPWLLLMDDDALFSFWYVRYAYLDRPVRARLLWGPERAGAGNGSRLAARVAQLQASGPVALTGFDAQVDRRFPYRLLTPSGNLWLASRNRLPQAARPLRVTDSPIVNERAGAGGLIGAAFRRAGVVASAGKLAPEELQELPPDQQRLFGHRGTAQLKRADMAAFEVDLVVHPGMLQLGLRQPESRRHRETAALCGWIEVLMARPQDLPAVPHPKQPSVTRSEGSQEAVLVSRQRRRLILPLTSRPGFRMRALVPVQVEGDSPDGVYHVWTRVITSPGDTHTPWKRTDLVRVTLH